MRIKLFAVYVFMTGICLGQLPLYEYRDLDKSLKVPDDINRERSAVIILVPNEVNEFTTVGNWKKVAMEAHKAFITMGVDAILYINHYDLMASSSSKESYASLFQRRQVKNLIFITLENDSYELMIAPFSGNSRFVQNKAPVFYVQDLEMYGLLLKTGKEIRRADHEIFNFLIPEKPNFLGGISIIEKTQLKNYPGILRRSTLAVERFAPMIIPEGINDDLKSKIEVYNADISEKNQLLETLIQQYPYEYVMIDPMTDDDLLRNKHQFILRCISGQAQTLRRMLDYSVDPNETDFVSIIPILPDQTRAKPIPKEALVHKFYIKQNISKNVHVGEWDADVTWQSALTNMIGNLILEHESTR